ncbi:bifunctional 3-phenylpropionate/cinnamic acid dioxygenase ferredoxin subunit [Auraticoccus sp. F435]|uniref:Bifunctional 3-phenylpropionate/cinnamic acid dioxygenase ferredoxin subunit n=1 Tax=Auraticoccus cholistanensis TaxID=2656650 RepID=A0A6A9V068_9ACTN|nr:bifunctional 3-phenylpropionate/cinnamic acid dioxygenase ferredoxin subunit [Auraticoccus cholistanensis]MVA75059.1 bifunctional 3-phenylpropionate/cinnamic acid dioxygenase ferredoxin subunit [Auraticoccus cholistanensis]
MSEGMKVATVSDLEAGEAVVVEAKVTGTEDDIALFRDDDGTFYALDDTCSHQEASLADGWVEDGEVECPLHAARFCLRTGAALCLPATAPVRTHRVELRGEDVWLFPGEPAA